MKLEKEVKEPQKPEARPMKNGVGGAAAGASSDSEDSPPLSASVGGIESNIMPLSRGVPLRLESDLTSPACLSWSSWADSVRKPRTAVPAKLAHRMPKVTGAPGYCVRDCRPSLARVPRKEKTTR